MRFTLTSLSILVVVSLALASGAAPQPQAHALIGQPPPNCVPLGSRCSAMAHGCCGNATCVNLNPNDGPFCLGGGFLERDAEN
ncbi:hypothetical protein MSAN_02205800 [Mycena sanguinolenta]|uniref:Uncharacterized protein n=1 Tax=Mycena sanguinolenta TaxID=230812 RepID=A0A8H7CJS9_9AGAR|nr:hypothetical protein MSAN_02205800 [Mycena sanguinolenta]